MAGALALAVAAVLSLLVTVQPLRDPDVWWHLALGRYILQHGIPAAEPFSFIPAAHHWVGQQWLYEVVLVHLVDAGGPGLASLTLGLVATAALIISALSAPRWWRAPGPWIAACLLLSALVAGEVLGVRGQVVSVLGVAVTLLILSRWRAGATRAVWALPPLLLVWSNLHAGFVAGLIIPLVVAAVHRPRSGAAPVDRLALLTAITVSAITTLVTPAGLRLYPYVAETLSNPTITQMITEWMSPDFHALFPRLLEVEALLLIAVWVGGDGPEVVDVVVAGGALAATLQAQRNVALFAVIALPQLVRHGGEAWRRLRPRRPAPPMRRLAALGVALGAVTVGVGLALGPTLSPRTAADHEASDFPRAAVDHVRAHLAGQRIYTTYELGGYLAHRIPTGRVVFIYGESAVFGTSGLQLYTDIHLLRPGWPELLAAEGIHHAVLPVDAQETTALRELGWTADCRDDRSRTVVLSRDPSPGARGGHC